MIQKTNTELKQTFQTGDVPTEAQFGDLIDSTRNVYLDKSWVANGTTFNEGQCTFTFGKTVNASGVASNDRITDAGNVREGDRIEFTTLTGGAGLSLATTYYVVNVDYNLGFQVSLTKGGSVVDITSDYSALAYKILDKICFIDDTAPNTATGFLNIPFKPYECRIGGRKPGGSGGFYYNTGVTTLNVPPNITHIGSQAFYNFSGGAIAGTCKIPDSVKSIGSLAFYFHAGITELELGQGIEHIGTFAFWLCSGFSEVVIPKSVTRLETSVFDACIGLTTAYIGCPASSFTGISQFQSSGLTNVYAKDAVANGYTLGSQTFYGKAGVTVAEWTNYPDPMP